MLKRLSEQDYYQVLEVDYSATPEEIQTAFESAREIYSGDSLVSISILSEEERRRILRRITEAYNTLIAEESRRLYDATLSRIVDSSEQPEVDEADRTTEPKASAFPRLVKGAQVSEERRPRATVRLGLKDEASGEFLRRARESAGLDLRTISEETKIGVTMLGYIEEERLDMLPAAIYLRNFVSQYAHCLGLDPEKVARSFLARIRRLEADKRGR